MSFITDTMVWEDFLPHADTTAFDWPHCRSQVCIPNFFPNIEHHHLPLAQITRFYVASRCLRPGIYTTWEDCEMVCKANRQMKWRIVNSPAQAFAEWDSQCFLTRCDHLVAGGLPVAHVSTQSSATIPPAPPSTPVEAIASSSEASVSAAPSTPSKSLSKSISKSPSESPTKMVGSPSKGKGIASTTFYALRSPGKKGIFNNRDDTHQALETAGPSASLVYAESLQAASSFLEENEVDNIDDFTGEVDQTDL
ncbi:hypothetical protein C8J56DRAFT_1056280 [Mycena floridula]|nr:hypothetical protein C8J56DRAFT_1056280 [Mycena floridula]